MEEFTGPREDGQKPRRQQNVFSGQKVPYPGKHPLGTAAPQCPLLYEEEKAALQVNGTGFAARRALLSSQTS